MLPVLLGLYFIWLQDVNFIRSYSKPPTVVLTAKHSTNGGNAAAECNGIISWIEVHKILHFTVVCLVAKTLF